MPPPLEVESAVKRFHRGDTCVEALRRVNLTVEAGELVVIMGASGSGKSTLLHAMAGLTDLDEGRVAVAGQDLAALSDARLTRFRGRHIGLIFQAFNLIPVLTAEDNIRLPACEVPDVDAKVEALLERLDLKERRAHRPDALSGGEQQRVAIARALITDPSIVLADEPTGSLDSVSGQSICALLRALCTEQKRTIVVVTHEPSVAMWGDRVVVLRDGAELTDFPTGDTQDPQTIMNRYQEALRLPVETS